MSDESLDLMLNVLLGGNTVSKFESGMASIEDALEGVDKKSIELAGTFANVLDKRLKALDAQFAKSKKQIDSMKQSADKLGAISQTMFVAGSAIVGGLYLAAKKEADRVIEAGGEVDAVTERWIAANERISSSQQKIGRSAEAAVVPLLEKVAGLAETAADFVDKNPDLISAALNIGVWTAGIGAIGVAVSKGIKLAADIKYLAATAQFTIDAAAMNTAAATMFEAAVLMQGGSVGAGAKVAASGVGKTATAGLSSLAPVAGVALAVAFAAAATKYIGNAFQRAAGVEESSWGDIFTTAKQVAMLPTKLALLGLVDVGIVSEETGAKVNNLQNELFGLGDASEETDKAAEEAAANLKDEADAMKKMGDLARDNAKAEREYADDREKILTDTSRALADSNRDLSKNLRDISTTMQSDIRRINTDLRSTLKELSASFAAENEQAERDYQSERASIIASGNDEVRNIQQQAKNDLEDLEREHSTSLKSLIANRDALGIANENIAFKEKQELIKRDASEAAAQARANTQAQLAEAARNFEEQRAQRQTEYLMQKEEAKAKAAADIADAREKAAEEKKRAMEANAEEKAEIERKRVEQLADLKKSYDRERSERITAVYNEITDLKGALNAERLMRQTYNNQILADAAKHMQSMVAVQAAKPSKTVTSNNAFNGATAGAGGSPTHDYSGYAYTGMYAMAQDGQREYVLSGAATKAAEQMVGGQLNQQALLSGLAGQRGNGMQYVDNASFSNVTVADMRRIRQQSRQEAISVMHEVYKK